MNNASLGDLFLSHVDLSSVSSVLFFGFRGTGVAWVLGLVSFCSFFFSCLPTYICGKKKKAKGRREGNLRLHTLPLAASVLGF